MFKRLTLFLLMAAIVITPAFGASDNSVDRVLAVKDDYSFEPGGAFVYLHIGENHANDFGSDSVSFRLKINNAEWFETGDPVTADPEAMEDNASMLNLAVIDIVRVGDHDLEITVNRSLANNSEKAWWRIPIYAKVTEAGIVSLEVDGRDGLVTSGVYNFATALGGNYLYAGYRFTPENPQWMTFREPGANAYAGTQKFKLVLENGTWFPDSETRMNTQAMLKAAEISGIEAGNITEIRRVNDKTIELTLQRGAESSVKSKGVWSLPLYFTVDAFGLAKVTVDSQDSQVTAGSLSSAKVAEPIRYIRTVTLTLNNQVITMEQGSDKRSVSLDVSPVNPSGSTFIPVRGLFEQLGGTVQWNAADRTVTIATEGKQIILSADSSSAKVDGAAVVLPQKPMIINGRLLIPLRSVSEQLGFGVEWVEATKQIIIRQD